MAQIPNCQCRGQNLTQNRRQGRAHHSPFEYKDKDGVQNDVHHRPRQGGGHGEFGAAVRADDGVHGLAEHIEGQAHGDPEEIALGLLEGLVIDPATKGREDAVGKDQVDCCHNQTENYAQHHSAADRFVRLFLFPRAQTDRHKCARAVADHYGNRQSNNCQREYNRVGSVAVTAQVRGVGDEDLIDDVIQSRHQQADDAGNGVLHHQLADRFLFQKVVFLVFHGKSPPAQRQKNTSDRQLVPLRQT